MYQIFDNKLLFIFILFIIFLYYYFFYILEIDYDVLKRNNVIEHFTDDYKVLEIYDILTPKECKILIEIAKNKGLQPSQVLVHGKTEATEVDIINRTSEQVWLSDQHHEITKKIAKITEKITGRPIVNQEELQVAHYKPNGKFQAHYDACIYEDKEYCDKMNHNAGQRLATLLIYLNEDFENGETEFIKLNLKIKPEVGKGILFYNVDLNQNLLDKSFHQGNSVINGEKWIATKWTHFDKFI